MTENKTTQAGGMSGDERAENENRRCDVCCRMLCACSQIVTINNTVICSRCNDIGDIEDGSAYDNEILCEGGDAGDYSRCTEVSDERYHLKNPCPKAAALEAYREAGGALEGCPSRGAYLEAKEAAIAALEAAEEAICTCGECEGVE